MPIHVVPSYTEENFIVQLAQLNSGSHNVIIAALLLVLGVPLWLWKWQSLSSELVLKKDQFSGLDLFGASSFKIRTCSANLTTQVTIFIAMSFS